MCMPCSTSRSAIFDLATVFSAAATNLPETARWIRLMTHRAITPTTSPSRAIAGFAQQRSHPARLGGLFERNLQARDGLGGQTLDRLPGQVVHVQRRETCHDPRSDADEDRAFEGLDSHGAGDPLSDQIVQGPFGGRRALCRRSAEDARPEDDDGTIRVGEGGGLRGWRRAQQRRRQCLWRRRGRRLRGGSDTAGEEDEAQHEPSSQTRQIAMPGSEAVRHAADSIRQ